MATAIIIAVIIGICVISLKSYLKKLSHGCCGAGGDDEKISEIDFDISKCKYKYTVKIGGMTCKNCSARIENALNKKQGIYAKIDFKSGIGEIFSEAPVPEFIVRQTVIGLGYSIERIEENAL